MGSARHGLRGAIHARSLPTPYAAVICGFAYQAQLRLAEVRLHHLIRVKPGCLDPHERVASARPWPWCLDRSPQPTRMTPQNVASRRSQASPAGYFGAAWPPPRKITSVTPCGRLTMSRNPPALLAGVVRVRLRCCHVARWSSRARGHCPNPWVTMFALQVRRSHGEPERCHDQRHLT